MDAGTEHGQKIAASFKATQFPYVAITDRKVEVLLAERTGRIGEDEWLVLLAKHRSGERAEPEVCFT